jgi:hypothetical protein
LETGLARILAATNRAVSMRIRRPFLYPVSGTIRFFSHILTRGVPIRAGDARRGV